MVHSDDGICFTIAASRRNTHFLVDPNYGPWRFEGEIFSPQKYLIGQLFHETLSCNRIIFCLFLKRRITMRLNQEIGQTLLPHKYTSKTGSMPRKEKKSEAFIRQVSFVH